MRKIIRHDTFIEELAVTQLMTCQASFQQLSAGSKASKAAGCYKGVDVFIFNSYLL